MIIIRIVIFRRSSVPVSNNEVITKKLLMFSIVTFITNLVEEYSALLAQLLFEILEKSSRVFGGGSSF